MSGFPFAELVVGYAILVILAVMALRAHEAMRQFGRREPSADGATTVAAALEVRSAHHPLRR